MTFWHFQPCSAFSVIFSFFLHSSHSQYFFASLRPPSGHPECAEGGIGIGWGRDDLTAISAIFSNFSRFQQFHPFKQFQAFFAF
jgi:hypothetical protein